MDLTKIKEAQARRDDRAEAWSSGPMSDDAEGRDRALLLVAVPGMISEIERLTRTAKGTHRAMRELGDVVRRYSEEFGLLEEMAPSEEEIEAATSEALRLANAERGDAL